MYSLVIWTSLSPVSQEILLIVFIHLKKTKVMLVSVGLLICELHITNDRFLMSGTEETEINLILRLPIKLWPATNIISAGLKYNIIYFRHINSLELNRMKVIFHQTLALSRRINCVSCARRSPFLRNQHDLTQTRAKKHLVQDYMISSQRNNVPRGFKRTPERLGLGGTEQQVRHR